MKIVLLGAPGSGKGTQAQLIEKEFGFKHISTGDIFRENMKNNTPLGLKVKEIMDKGCLCPDDLTINLVDERLKKADCAKSYLLDGFPRSIAQAQALDSFAKPDMVINVDVPLDIIERRIVGRRNCNKCGGSFHIDFIGNTMICPTCGAELSIRKDDNVTAVAQRLNAYKQSTEPVIDYYKNKNILYTVNGNCPVQEVFKQIKNILRNDNN